MSQTLVDSFLGKVLKMRSRVISSSQPFSIKSFVVFHKNELISKIEGFHVGLRMVFSLICEIKEYTWTSLTLKEYLRR